MGITYLASPYTPHNGESITERYDAVRKYAAKLMEQGETVFCPIAHSHPIGDYLPAHLLHDHDFWMKQDLPILRACTKLVVLMLPGWLESRGVADEVKLARELGLRIEWHRYDASMDEYAINLWTLGQLWDPHPFTPKETPKETILQEAQRLVHGDRGAAYGHPLDNFTQTAELWAAILETPVTAEEVALCMIAVKISRQCNAPKRDNVVDIAGYAETLQMTIEERARRGETIKFDNPSYEEWAAKHGPGRPAFTSDSV